jgi:hypothetical protein
MWKRALLPTLLLLSGCGPAERLQIVDDDCLESDLKVYPGVCGCAVPEELCTPLNDALVHRYAFDGTGDVAVDDIVGADGVIFNTALSGTGQLDLDRKAALEQYVELPNGIISALESATFEAWVVWSTPPPLADKPFWERIFDFGVSTVGEQGRERGQSYIFLAPGQPGTVPAIGRVAYQQLVADGETRLDAVDPFPSEVPFHVAVVVDAAAQELRLSLDGRDEGTVPLLGSLTAIEDVNNWLGRSQFVADSRFGGAFLEFRIYGKALSAAQLADSRELGPSPEFLSRRRAPQEP